MADTEVSQELLAVADEAVKPVQRGYAVSGVVFDPMLRLAELGPSWGRAEVPRAVVVPHQLQRAPYAGRFPLATASASLA